MLFFISLLKVQSQGFDWQYSARLPFEVPQHFIGFDCSSGYKSISSDFKICDQNIPCDTFNIGSAMVLSAGIKFEVWTSSDFSYFANLTLDYSKNSFKNENLFYYIPDIGSKVLEYEYIRTEYVPEIEIGVKYRMRFLLPHLFTSVSVRAGYIVNASEELILRKISEADWLDDEIHFTGFESLKLSQFLFEPHFKLGYDLNLGLGKYASVYIDLGLPLQNRLTEKSWHSTTVSAGVSIFPFGF
ncbi:MAG: hypothetical protein V1779_03095 [bacterium]